MRSGYGYTHRGVEHASADAAPELFFESEGHREPETEGCESPASDA